MRKLFLEGKKRLRDFAVLHKIHWKFITPLSPHQGGMYESLIKVTKRALRMSTGEQILSWNEMATVFAEVKSILGRYFVLQDEVDPPPPPGSLKNEACVVCIIPAVAIPRPPTQIVRVTLIQYVLV